MLETLIEKEELLTDTPYLQRIREQASSKARTEGGTERRAKGLSEGW